MSSVRTIEVGHEDMIHDAQLDYYSKHLATCSSDRRIRIFELGPNDTQTQVAELLGHEGPVWQVRWAHPRYGKMLASCSYDHLVIIWRDIGRNQWAKIHEFRGHETSVNSVCWGPHEQGLSLATASSDGKVAVISYIEGENRWSEQVFPAHDMGANCVCWIAPAKAEEPVRIVSGGCDHALKVWSFNNESGSWQLESTLEGHKDWVRDVTCAPNSSTFASCSQDNSVFVWKFSEGEEGEKGEWSKQPVQPECTAAAWSVSWSPNGAALAVGCADNKVYIYNASAEGFKLNTTMTNDPFSEPSFASY